MMKALLKKILKNVFLDNQEKKVNLQYRKKVLLGSSQKIKAILQ